MQGVGCEALQVLDRWAVYQGREVILPLLGLDGVKDLQLLEVLVWVQGRLVHMIYH